MASFFWPGKRKADTPENAGTETDENETKSPSWRKYDDLPLDQKRKLYRCGRDFVTLKNIPTWSEYMRENAFVFHKKREQEVPSVVAWLKGKIKEEPRFDVNETLNEKISLWKGDITSLEIDAIVNAANNSLLGGGGVDGCIHRAAGSTLRQECAQLNGCKTGDAKITSGHKLPAKHVIHTVGPIGKQEKLLTKCYKRCLQLVKKHGLRSVAFCCVSTGIYGYPIYDASCVALKTVRSWLESEDDEGNKHLDLVDRIIFCIFLKEDLDVYQHLFPKYFPSAEILEQESSQQENDDNTPKSDEDNDNNHINEEEGQPQFTQAEILEQESSQQENDDNPPNSDEDNDNNHINEEEGQPQFTQDMDVDEEALKQGVPDPPSLDEFSNLEENMTEDQESQVKHNVPREHEKSSMTEDKEITTI
ncbi:ADP-ribose glycohydrolase MACROD1-like isoform X1 [Montipora foliosa]|uniref:ADP-ribose glycohydrolase MACROD1-like isoform X1 n=1 Tax=Montipora foliosa TaxID=591990 RepID=UPI0035F1ADD0